MFHKQYLLDYNNQIERVHVNAMFQRSINFGVKFTNYDLFCIQISKANAGFPGLPKALLK